MEEAPTLVCGLCQETFPCGNIACDTIFLFNEISVHLANLKDDSNMVYEVCTLYNTLCDFDKAFKIRNNLPHS
jgi:hypothetical protein